MFKDEYQEARETLKLGITQPMFLDLKNFIEEQFEIKISSITFVQDLYYPNKKRHFLSIFILSKSDCDKMFIMTDKFYGSDTIKDKQIEDKFIELNEKYKYFARETLKNFLVVYVHIGSYIIQGMNRQYIKKVEQFIKNKFNQMDIWLVDSLFEVIYIFFKTTKELNFYEATGELEKIKQSYLSFIKPYDEFGVYEVNDLSMQFTSKEIIDKDYDGDIYNFFRCV